jgi:hypothetical protein
MYVRGLSAISRGGGDYFAYFVPVSAPPGHGVRVVPDQGSGKHPGKLEG